jgi:hypothetical protein
MIVPWGTAITCRRGGSEWRVLPPWGVVTSPAPRRTGSQTGRSARGAAALLRYSSSLQLSDLIWDNSSTYKNLRQLSSKKTKFSLFRSACGIFHCKETIPKIRNKYSQKRYCAATVQFPHSCVCERFIYSHNRSAYSSAGKYVDRPWENINHSQTRESRNWDWGRATPRKGIHKWDFRCSVVFAWQF